jgi:hypothetical protein
MARRLPIQMNPGDRSRSFLFESAEFGSLNAKSHLIGLEVERALALSLLKRSLFSLIAGQILVEKAKEYLERDNPNARNQAEAYRR